MVEKVKIHGLEGVRKALRELPKDLRKRELDKALTPGAKIIRDTAKSLAPRGERSFTKTLKSGKEWAHVAGSLAKSIVVRNEKKKYLKNTAMKKIGVLSDKKNPDVGAWYWRFVEFGTVKMPAKPFLVPAFESMKYAANEAIKAALLKGVEASARRVKSKTK